MGIHQDSRYINSQQAELAQWRRIRSGKTYPTYSWNTGPWTLAGSVAASTETLTFTGNAGEGETVVIGSQTYTYTATVSAANDVLIGASASDSLDNLIAAVNGTGVPGTQYGTGTTAHEIVVAVAGAGDTMDINPQAAGAQGNISLSTDVTGASWSNATASGGVTSSAVYVVDDNIRILEMWTSTESDLYNVVITLEDGSVIDHNKFGPAYWREGAFNSDIETVEITNLDTDALTYIINGISACPAYC